MNRQTAVEESTSSLTCARPIELYVFIDPLCQECWAMQPLLRRLQVEYERYFTLRIALRTSLKNLNTQANECELPYCEQTNLSFPSLAIKAAEFQGKRAGFRYLSKLLDYSLLQTKNITSFDVLLSIAEELELDIDEFRSDFTSKNVLRSLQLDLFLAKEMEVDRSPTFVFFNENIEDEGLKVDGLYDYEVYEQILSELVPYPIEPDTPPTILELLSRFYAMTTEEIAAVYRSPVRKVERELKKSLLKQQLERIPFNQTDVWKKRSFPSIPNER